MRYIVAYFDKETGETRYNGFSSRAAAVLFMESLGIGWRSLFVEEGMAKDRAAKAINDYFGKV